MKQLFAYIILAVFIGVCIFLTFCVVNASLSPVGWAPISRVLCGALFFCIIVILMCTQFKVLS